MGDILPNFREQLQVLTDHGVDFLVVGGVCAVLHGAPLLTYDLDVVHSRDPDNLDRLVTALREMDAIYREQPQRRLRPDQSHLRTTGHQLLMTRAGPLDVLGTLSSGRGYDELVGCSLEMDLGAGLRVRVLDLPTLILTKEEAGRDKDRIALPILRRALEEQARGTAPTPPPEHLPSRPDADTVDPDAKDEPGA